ncbi:MAG: ribosome-binding factor A [Gemmataceae bacterium]
MPRKPKIARRNIARYCSEISPEDGLDPRFDCKENPHKVQNRKALQLCGQVFRTLSAVLGGECDDEILRDLMIDSVTPAPNAARLLVTVYPFSLASVVPPEAILARLHQAHGLLRSEVAAAINRRKTPDLIFHVINPPKTIE